MITEEKIKHANTKFGKIEFKYFPNYETTGLNKDWVGDKVVASLNGQEIGYLKIRYIPMDRMEKSYSTIFPYIAEYSSWYGIGEAFEKNDLSGLVAALGKYVHDVELNKMRVVDIKNQDSLWLKNKLAQLIKNIPKGMVKEYKKFKAHWADAPLVDFINVDDKFKGGGVGFGLYMAGAMWLADKNMCLHASSLQSVEAKKSWDNMAAKGLPVKKYKNAGGEVRTCLDYRK